MSKRSKKHNILVEVQSDSWQKVPCTYTFTRSSITKYNASYPIKARLPYQEITTMSVKRLKEDKVRVQFHTAEYHEEEQYTKPIGKSRNLIYADKIILSIKDFEKIQMAWLEKGGYSLIHHALKDLAEKHKLQYEPIDYLSKNYLAIIHGKINNLAVRFEVKGEWQIKK